MAGSRHPAGRRESKHNRQQCGARLVDRSIWNRTEKVFVCICECTGNKIYKPCSSGTLWSKQTRETMRWMVGVMAQAGLWITRCVQIAVGVSWCKRESQTDASSSSSFEVSSHNTNNLEQKCATGRANTRGSSVFCSTYSFRSSLLKMLSCLRRFSSTPFQRLEKNVFKFKLNTLCSVTMGSIHTHP